MLIHYCDDEPCKKQLIQGRDMINGELNIDFPNVGERGPFLLQLRAYATKSPHPTDRDLCKECLIEQLKK